MQNTSDQSLLSNKTNILVWPLGQTCVGAGCQRTECCGPPTSAITNSRASLGFRHFLFLHTQPLLTDSDSVLVHLMPRIFIHDSKSKRLVRRVFSGGRRRTTKTTQPVLRVVACRRRFWTSCRSPGRRVPSSWAVVVAGRRTVLSSSRVGQ